MIRNDHREAELSSAKAVANFFLGCGERDGAPIDQLKLQKLVYYAHAWHLANDMGALFPDDIEAWPHGPVVRDLYVEFCEFKRKPITRRAMDLYGSKPSIVDVQPETRKLLDEIWGVLGKYSGVRLSNSTHAPGEPWTIVKEHYLDLSKKPRIPNDLIERIFKEKLVQAT